MKMKTLHMKRCLDKGKLLTPHSTLLTDAVTIELILFLPLSPSSPPSILPPPSTSSPYS